MTHGWKKEKKISREILKYLEINEKGNTTNQKLCDAAKAVLREKFINENAWIGEEISKINNLLFYLKKLERG